MGTTVLGFSSTPRPEGNSDILLEHVLAGAREAGAQTDKIRLAELSIAPCRACGACKRSRQVHCAIDDDMLPLLDRIREAQAIVLASPVYFFTMSAQLKTFLDRWYALVRPDGVALADGLRVGLVLSYGGQDAWRSGAANAVRTLQDGLGFLGVTFAGCVHASCGKPAELRDRKGLLAEAAALGRRLMKT